MNTPRNRYVQPEVGEARVDRLWRNVSQRLEARPSHTWRWAVLCTALAGAAGGGLFWFETAPSVSPHLRGGNGAVLADAKLQTKSDELSVTLADGSSLKLGSQSEVQVRSGPSSSVSLQLARGELWCDVTHREERKFSVVAGDVEVRVVGTEFSVKRTPGPSPGVLVNVTRGVVEVVSARRPGVVSRVGAGESWAQDAPSAPSAAGPAGEPPSGEPAKGEAAQPLPSGTALAPSARELFEKAGDSRRTGDALAAAHAYEELLRRHPGDGRASLAAFELGRLRMDRLGDLPGAISALERAVAMDIGPSFREDALARLVSVYASQRNWAACKRARDRYAASYPAGVHRAAVATRCGSD